MNLASRKSLLKLLGATESPGASIDDLQGLLLQVTIALLMIFMIAYFMFVAKTEKEREEAVMDINRQKLELAIDKVAETKRIRYGLNALMTQGVDGKRVFNPDDHFLGLKLQLSPASRNAFGMGSKAAYEDYENESQLSAKWLEEVLLESGIDKVELANEEIEWLVGKIGKEVENVRLDVRGVQRSLAARLQRIWVENPKELSAIEDAGAIADALKSRSTKLLEEETGGKLLK